MIRLAGRWADGTVATAPVGYMPFIRTQLTKGGAKRSNALKDIIPGNDIFVMFSEDQTEIKENFGPIIARMIADTPDSCHIAAGIPIDKVERIRAKRKSHGLPAAAEIITPQMLDAYSATGSVDKVAHLIQAHIDAGVEQVMISVPHKPFESLKIVGKEILPLY